MMIHLEEDIHSSLSVPSSVRGVDSVVSILFPDLVGIASSVLEGNKFLSAPWSVIDLAMAFPFASAAPDSDHFFIPLL